MKKILLGLVAAAALVSFTAPARAEGEGAAPAGDAKPAKKGKKKGKKADDAAAAPADDAAKPAK